MMVAWSATGRRALLAVSVFALTLAAGAAEAPPDFSKMRIKQLRAVLDERGVECKACSEKADLVARAAEVWHLPVLPPEPEPEATKRSVPGSAEPDADEINRILEQMGLGKNGGGSDDPEKAAVLKRLRAKGLNFAGGNTMTTEQLINLEESLSGFNTGRNGADDEL